MERNHLLWLGIFLLLCAANLTGVLTESQPLIYATKPLLMPALALWFGSRTSGIRRFLRQTLFAGLAFATLGDTLLLFSGGNYGAFFFLLGLGAFLCTHLCYIGGFLREVNPRNGYLRQQPLLVLPFLLFLVAFLYWLWPGIPEGMRLPVAVYAATISVMALSVLNLRPHIEAAAFSSMLAGALLFMLSDSLIAVQKFGQAFPGSHVSIIATYLVGQWALIRGASMHLRRFPA